MDPYKPREKPEEKIQIAIINKLKILDWFVKPTVGNMYQSGFPDLFCCHSNYGHRWVEVKNPGHYRLTPAQIDWFPKMCAHGSGVWIVTSPDQVPDVLMTPFNWYQFLPEFKV